MDFEKYVNAAKNSKFGLFKLNLGLGYVIPFNRPHKIKILEIKDDSVKTIIPYRRKNFNHIKGLHACGMATAAEFSSGFMLILSLIFIFASASMGSSYSVFFDSKTPSNAKINKTLFY